MCVCVCVWGGFFGCHAKDRQSCMFIRPEKFIIIYLDKYCK